MKRMRGRYNQNLLVMFAILLLVFAKTKAAARKYEERYQLEPQEVKEINISNIEVTSMLKIIQERGQVEVQLYFIDKKSPNLWRKISPFDFVILDQTQSHNQISKYYTLILTAQYQPACGFITVSSYPLNQFAMTEYSPLVLQYDTQQFIIIENKRPTLISILPRRDGVLQFQRLTNNNNIFEEGMGLAITVNRCKTFQQKQCIDELDRLEQTLFMKKVDHLELIYCSNCVVVVKIELVLFEVNDNEEEEEVEYDEENQESMRYLDEDNNIVCKIRMNINSNKRILEGYPLLDLLTATHQKQCYSTYIQLINPYHSNIYTGSIILYNASPKLTLYHSDQTTQIPFTVSYKSNIISYAFSYDQISQTKKSDHHIDLTQICICLHLGKANEKAYFIVSNIITSLQKKIQFSSELNQQRPSQLNAKQLAQEHTEQHISEADKQSANKVMPDVNEVTLANKLMSVIEVKPHGNVILTYASHSSSNDQYQNYQKAQLIQLLISGSSSHLNKTLIKIEDINIKSHHLVRPKYYFNHNLSTINIHLNQLSHQEINGQHSTHGTQHQYTRRTQHEQTHGTQHQQTRRTQHEQTRRTSHEASESSSDNSRKGQQILYRISISSSNTELITLKVFLNHHPAQEYIQQIILPFNLPYATKTSHSLIKNFIFQGIQGLFSITINKCVKCHLEVYYTTQFDNFITKNHKSQIKMSRSFQNNHIIKQIKFQDNKVKSFGIFQLLKGETSIYITVRTNNYAYFKILVNKYIPIRSISSYQNKNMELSLLNPSVQLYLSSNQKNFIELYFHQPQCPNCITKKQKNAKQKHTKKQPENKIKVNSQQDEETSMKFKSIENEQILIQEWQQKKYPNPLQYFTFEGSLQHDIAMKAYCPEVFFDFLSNTGIKDISFEQIHPISAENDMLLYTIKLQHHDFIGVIAVMGESIVSYEVVEITDIRDYNEMRWSIYFVVVFLMMGCLMTLICFMVLKKRRIRKIGGEVYTEQVSGTEETLAA